VEDYVNGFFSALSLPFFSWVMYHHWLCYRWDEEVDSLRWVAGTTFITSAVYFSLLYMDVLAKGIIWVTAWLTVALLGGLGYDASLGGWTYDTFEGHALVIRGNSSGDNWISIVLACTGMQAIALFLGAILALRPKRSLWEKWAREIMEENDGQMEGEPARGDGDREVPPQTYRRSRGSGSGLAGSGGVERTKNRSGNEKMGLLAAHRRRRVSRLYRMSDRERSARALLYTAPVIFLANLARNVAIVFLVYEDHLDFYTAHHIYAKSLAFFLLIVLTLACFFVLPELQENILGLMDLGQRRKKGDIKDGFVKLELLRNDDGD
jgi:exosortase/archaeosortase family protein